MPPLLNKKTSIPLGRDEVLFRGTTLVDIIINVQLMHDNG